MDSFVLLALTFTLKALQGAFACTNFYLKALALAFAVIANTPQPFLKVRAHSNAQRGIQHVQSLMSGEVWQNVGSACAGRVGWEMQAGPVGIGVLGGLARLLGLLELTRSLHTSSSSCPPNHAARL
jgi:hypothetical protein